MQKRYLASFGDIRLGISANRFHKNALAMRAFDDIFIYTEASLPLDFKEEFKDKFYIREGSIGQFYNSGTPIDMGGGGKLIASRGFGYWVWKPKVILMVLEQIKEGDLLIYCDIGFEFNTDRQAELFKIFDELNEHEIMATRTKVPQKICNKADLLEHYGLRTNEAFLNSYNHAAGVVFIKKCERTVNFIKEWLSMFYTHYHLIDDSPSKLQEHPEFIQNLHDQSIYSILCDKYKVFEYKDEAYFLTQESPLQYHRNKAYLPNSYEDNKTLDKTIRRNKYGNITIELIHKSSIHYEFLLNILSNFKLDSIYEDFSKAYIDNDRDGIFTYAQAILNLVSWDFLKYKSFEKLQDFPNLKQILDQNKANSSFLTFQMHNSAKNRIRNHLAYKIGSTIIENSKSLLGYIRMLYVLSYIKDKHKEEQRIYQEKIKNNPNSKLPPLETYIDYKEALKLKEHLSYKLGSAFIKAHKTWYKGGYIKFIFVDVGRIKKEFRKIK